VQDREKPGRKLRGKTTKKPEILRMVRKESPKRREGDKNQRLPGS